MESPIDQQYRLMLLEYYLENPKEVALQGGSRKWQFVCPFCGSQGRTEAKKQHRKAALLWNATQHSWVFSCAKKGSVACMSGKTLGNLLSALNLALGEVYRRERWHSGTTGKGHNCRAPERVAGISAGSYGLIMSKRLP